MVLDKLFHLLGEAAASALQQSEHLLQARGVVADDGSSCPFPVDDIVAVAVSVSVTQEWCPVAVELECVLRFKSTSHHRLLQKMRNPATEDTDTPR